MNLAAVGRGPVDDMKVLVLGDVHGEVDRMMKVVERVSCDLVLQTGDLGAYCDLSKPMYFIAGNHEDWKAISDMDAGRARFKNLHHIKTAETIRFTGSGESVSISGINGNYSPKRYGKVIQNRERHFTREDVERCKGLKNIDIFLSHEPPAGIGFVKRGEDVGVPPIKEILDSVRPVFLFFCHHHVYFETVVGKSRIFGLDYAWREHYILDTRAGMLERKTIDYEP